MNGYKEISACRVCGNANLQSLLDIGLQALTGVFPRNMADAVPLAPLHLVKCAEENNGDTCGLVQLKHSCNPAAMYGMNYGYRSGLNGTMVAHLKHKAWSIKKKLNLSVGDLVLDIGSNDGTFLGAMAECGLDLVGMDPTGEKFKQYYPPHVCLIPDFFSGPRFCREFGARKAKVIASIAMFYDLEAPLDFMQQIAEVLADDGIWVFEQSYLPAMLSKNSYDTICHEHLEYYSLKQIKFMADRAGLKILDIEFNGINGGSFSVTAAKNTSEYSGNEALVKGMIEQEMELGLRSLVVYERFRERILQLRQELNGILGNFEKNGRKVFGYGASTKGNVLLQFCGITAKQIPFIAEVNQDKVGCFTPHTRIPIISEEEARSMRPDAFLVLPWHFRSPIMARERSFLESGGKLIFPLPKLEVVAQ